MIKFFRHIRKDLMEKNKTVNYLKYAFGEIILVVIGILIALQINNWNEQRIQKLEEIQILIDIKSNINNCIIDMNKGIDVFETSKSLSLKLLSFIDENQAYNQSYDTIFGGFFDFWLPDFTDGAYINLKTEGLSLIQNTSLRQNVVMLFEVELAGLNGYFLEADNNFYTNTTFPYCLQHFTRPWKTEEAKRSLIPKNYNALMADPEFYSILTEIVYKRKLRIQNYQETIVKAEKVKTEIDKELKHLQND